jgi:hypothetical protein
VQQSAAPVPPLLLTQQHRLHLSITAGQFEDSAIEPLGIASAQSRPRKEPKVIPQRWCIADEGLPSSKLPSVDGSEPARSADMITVVQGN